MYLTTGDGKKYSDALLKQKVRKKNPSKLTAVLLQTTMSTTLYFRVVMLSMFSNALYYQNVASC